MKVKKYLKIIFLCTFLVVFYSKTSAFWTAILIIGSVIIYGLKGLRELGVALDEHEKKRKLQEEAMGSYEDDYNNNFGL
jgi:hypothetical protein